MSCNLFIDSTELNNAIVAASKGNSILATRYTLESKSETFAKELKDKLGIDINNIPKNKLNEVIKLLQEYHNKLYPDINYSTQLNTSDSPITRFGYDSIATREFGKKLASNFILSAYHQLVHDKNKSIQQAVKEFNDKTGNDISYRDYFANAAIAKVKKLIIERLESRGLATKQEVLQLMKTNNTAKLEELFAKDRRLEDSNLLAMYKEILGNRKAFFEEVFRNNALGELRLKKQPISEDTSYEAIDEQIEEELDSEENNDSTTDDKNNSIKELNEKLGDYNNFMTHVGMSIRGYFSSLPKIINGEKVNGKYVQDTNNPFGIADTMSAAQCISVLYSYGNFVNTKTMIDSIHEIANNVPGMAAFHQFADYLDTNPSFAFEVYRTFSKSVVTKIETTDANGEFSSRTSNRTADKLTALKFEFFNSAKATAIRSEVEHSIDIFNNIDKQLKELRKFKKELDTDNSVNPEDIEDFNKEVKKVATDLYNLLKRYYPTLSDKAIINYVNSGNQIDNLANLSNIAKLTIKGASKSKLTYDSRQADLNALYRKRGQLTQAAENGEPINKNIFEEIENQLNQLYSIDYVSSETQNAAYQLAETLVKFSLVKTELNSRNVHGNQSSDVLNNSMITNIINTLKDQTALENFGKYRGQSRQYDFSNIMIEHRDEDGTIINYGLFTQNPDSRELTPTPYANRLLQNALFSGAGSVIDGKNVLYSEMSRGDYTTTAFINFFRTEDDFNQQTEADKITFAEYFMRIPSDAPKNFIIKAPKYSVNGLFTKDGVNINHPIFKQFRQVFIQELQDMATAINVLFEHEGGKVRLDTDEKSPTYGMPIFKPGYANDEETARKLYNNYHTKKGKILKKLSTGQYGLLGDVFTSDRFKVTITNENGKLEAVNFADEILKHFNLLYGGANNTYLHTTTTSNGVTVQLTNEQNAIINEQLSKFIIAYSSRAVSELSVYKSFIPEELLTKRNAAEFALNHRLMYIGFNDLFEGDTKFYKDTQTFLKRAKEAQGSGVPYGIVDYQMDLSEEPTLVDSPLNNMTFNHISVDGVTSQVKINQYSKFRGVTIKNTIRTGDTIGTFVTDKNGNPVKDENGNYTFEKPGVLAKTLIDALVASGMNKANAKIHAANMMVGYTNTTVNDAQSYITFEEWVRRITARGQLPQYKELIDAVLDESKPLDAKTIGQFIQVQKNFYYDQHYNAELGVIAPRQIKNAEFVIVPRLVRGTQLEQVYNLMKEFNIDQLNTEETSKAGKCNVLTLWDNEGNLTDANIADFRANAVHATEYYNYNYLYTQQETPQHLAAENKAGIQIMKKIIDNIDSNSELYPLKQKFFNLYSQNIIDSYENLIQELHIKRDENGEISAFDQAILYDMLKDEVARLGLDSNMMDYVTLDKDGVPIMPTHMSNVSTKLESIAQSLFNNRITRQKLPGWHAAQITNIGWAALSDTVEKRSYSKKLKYHPDGKPYVEIMLPKSNFKNLEYKKKDGTLKTDEELLTELSESGLDTMIGYRIPTEGKQSVCVMKVVGFVDDALGSTIVVPDDWVSQTGSDFDIDSVYGIHFSGEVNKETGKLEKVKYNEEDKRSDNKTKGRNNELLQTMIDILSHPSSLEENLSRSNFEDIINDRDEVINPELAKLRKARSPYDFFDQAAYQEDVMSGAKLKAFSVTRDTFCSICNTVRPNINANKTVSIVYKKENGYTEAGLKKHFSNVKRLKDGSGWIVTHDTLGWSLDNKNVVGKIITAYSSQTTAHILDAVKEGSIPNVNDFTFQVYKLFPDIGSDYKTAIAFMMQPGVTRIVDIYNANKSIYGENSGNVINEAIKQIATEILKNYGIAVPKNPSIKVLLGKLRNVSSEIAELFDVVEADKFNIEDTRAANMLNISASKLKDRINQTGEFSTTSPVGSRKQLLYDLGVILQYNKLNLLANDISSYARVCNPDKFGAKQTIYATAKVFDDIQTLVKGSNPSLTVNGTSFISAIYPKVDKGLDNYMKETSIEESAYPPLNAFLRYATATSIKINRTLFATQSDEFRHEVEKLSTLFSNGRTISEKEYKDFQNYILNYIYNQARIIAQPVTFIRGEGFYYGYNNKDNKSRKNTNASSHKFPVMFTTSGSTSYPKRTSDNAQWSDITLALAEDFTTAGERLTKRVAGDKYVSESLNNDTNTIINSIYEQIVNKRQTKNIKLNVAGNGIYSMKESQEYYDELLTTIIKGLIDKGITVSAIRSGGQTGIDEAGIKAAINLNIPAEVHSTSNFKFRNKQGIDISNKAQFKLRFGNYENISDDTDTYISFNLEDERRRIYGYGKTPILEVLDENGEIIEFKVEDINHPTELEIQQFASLSPAQKIHYIQENFENSGVFKYIDVSLYNRGSNAGKQTIRYIENNEDIETIYNEFEKCFFNDNPIVALAAMDIVKYGFVVEGFKMRKNAVNKVIKNSVLLSDKTGIISDISTAIATIKDNAISTNQLRRNYIRSHSNGTFISGKKVYKKKDEHGNWRFELTPRADGIILVDNESLASKYGIIYDPEPNNRNYHPYESNSYVKLSFNGVSNLYRITKVDNIYVLYPVNKLEENESSDLSVNPLNNKFLREEYYLGIINDFRDQLRERDKIGENAPTVDFSAILEKHKTEREQYKPKTVKRASGFAKSFDINSKNTVNTGGFEDVIAKVTERFSENPFSTLYLRSTALSNYITSPGIQGSSIQIINGKRYVIQKVNLSRLNKKYIGEENKDKVVKEPNKDIQEIMQKAQSAGYTVHDVFMITPYEENVEVMQSSVTEEINELPNSTTLGVQAMATMFSRRKSEGDVEAAKALKFLQDKQITGSAPSVHENTKDVIQTTAEYIDGMVNKLFTDMKYFIKDDNLQPFAINSPEAIAAIKADPAIRQRFLKTLLDARALVKNFAIINELDIQAEDDSLKPFLNKIKENINRLQNATIIAETERLFANEFLAKLSKNPLIQQDILGVLDGYHSASAFDAWVGDLQESPSPLIQIVSKEVMADIRSKEMMAIKRVQEFRKKLADIKRRAKEAGVDIDWKKIIDKNGKFIQNYNQTFLNKLAELRENISIAKSEHGVGSIEHLKAKLAYDKWKLANINQAVVDDYYRQKIDIEEHMISKYGAIYSAYKKLADKRRELISHTRNGVLADNYKQELEKVKREIDNLTNDYVYDQATGTFLEKYQVDDPNNPFSGINKVLYSIDNAYALQNYLRQMKELNDEYFEVDTKFGFQEELDRNLDIINNYEMRDANGNITTPIAELMKHDDYVKAKEWLASNARYVATEEVMDIVNSAFKIFRENKQGRKLLSIIAKKQDAYDERGVIDGRKLTEENIRQLYEEQLVSYGIRENQVFSDRTLISNSPTDDTIFTAAFYKGMTSDGAKNNEYIAKINEINRILKPHFTTHDGTLYTAELSEDEIKTLRKLYEELDEIKKYVKGTATNGSSVRKFIDEHVEFVYDEDKFKQQEDLAKQRGEHYYRMWLSLNTQIVEDENSNDISVPNRYIYGYAVPKGYKSDGTGDNTFVDKRKTDALHTIRSYTRSRKTQYYYEAYKEAQAKGQEEFRKWYNANHIYNPYTHTIEPLQCWTTLEFGEVGNDGQWSVSMDYIPAWNQTERKIKPEYSNPDYKEFSSTADNYKGNNQEYNSTVKRNSFEEEIKEYFETILKENCHTMQSQQFLRNGFMPLRKKGETPDAKYMAKEAAKLVGWINNSTGREDWYTDSEIDYSTDTTIDMPMTTLLKSKDSVKINRNRPVREENMTDEEYQVKVDKWEKDKAAAEEKNMQIHQDMLDDNWEAVMEEFIQKAAHFNAIQDNKYMLFYAKNMIDKLDVYVKNEGFNDLQKTGKRTIDGQETYVTKKDTRLQEQYTNWIRRLVYEQWKKPNNGLTRAANIMQSLTSAKFMMLNVTGGIANVTVGSTQILGEVFAREYFGNKTWHLGLNTWRAGIPSFMADMYKDRASSLPSAIVKFMNVIDFDELNGVVSVPNMTEYLKRARDLAFSPQAMGEHLMQNSAMFAMMYSHRLIKTVNTETGEIKYEAKNEAEYMRDANEKALKSVMTEEQRKLYEAFKKKELSNANETKEYAWFRKDLTTEFVNIYFNNEDKAKFIAKRKEYQAKAKEEFNNDETHPTVMSQLKLDDGILGFKDDSIFAQIGDEAYQILGSFKGRVISVNKKIHGVYDKLGAAKWESYWWGGLVMQYHKHIYPGIMKRYRRQGYFNEERGTIEKGCYASIKDFLALPLHKRKFAKKLKEDNNMTDADLQAVEGVQNIVKSYVEFALHFKTHYQTLNEYDRANIRRAFGDFCGVASALCLAIALHAAGDDDKEHNILYNLMMYEADRLASESFMYNPIGVYGEGKKLWSSPIAASSSVSDLLGTFGLISQYVIQGDEFDPYYSTGLYKGENKLWVQLRRNIPVYHSINMLQRLERSNKYYKLGDNMLSIVPVKDIADFISD